NTQTAEYDEGPAPAVLLSDQASEESSCDRADVDAGLVCANRARSCVRAMIIADERHGSGKVERFADSFERTHREEAVESVRERSRGADRAPCVQASEDCGFAAHAIHDISRKERTQAIDPGKGAAEQSKLDCGEAHRFLQQREDREDRLPVGVIKECD